METEIVVNDNLTGKALKLSFSDRLFYIGILFPKETNILNGLVLRDIKKKIELSPNESDKFALKNIDNSIKWELENNIITAIIFSTAELLFLKEQVAILDKQSKITPELLDIALQIQEINLTGK